jgi:hypothetical protein
MTAYSRTVSLRQHEGGPAPISSFRTTTIGSHRGTPISALHVLALLLVRSLVRTLSATQAQSLALAISRSYQRALSLAQTQTPVLRRQVDLPRGLSQTQSLALTRQMRLTRVITQSEVATVSLQKVILRVLTITQPQSARLLRSFVLSLQQAQQALPVGWPTRLILWISQQQQLSVAARPQPVRLVLAISQPQAALPVGTFIMGPERTFLVGSRCQRFAVAGRGLRFSVQSRSRRFGVRAPAPQLSTVIGPGLNQRRRGPPSTPMIRRR